MTELAAENWKRRIKMDILAIAVALALQDGPFFCLRMTLIFRSGDSHFNLYHSHTLPAHPDGGTSAFIPAVLTLESIFIHRCSWTTEGVASRERK